ncbi:thiamine ABC transporter substrate-binding protein [Nocardioides sp. Y6]|uniref:Thiamine ABC transporter substrate-binding protein n=1 Tax=Nocardioides malaquae TaxID=2773426 RepID=A0ABR9RWJ7_9ACTN|nr:thiamine ABC transporter substrate-binding protein [Nocardioides malaquae]MBE7325485.1 thiamine ABC transporter substrate-binding protein [Nocardioides malaquae]
MILPAHGRAPRPRRVATTASTGVAGLLLATTLTACSLLGGDSGGDSDSDSDAGSGDAPSKVVLLTHSSFELPEELVTQFESETGLELVVRAAGDAGQLATKLALTAGNPSGDATFGVDNTFASRVLEAGALAPHETTLPEGADDYALDQGADRLAPVDQSHVCLNVDTTWFSERDLEPPATLEDLTDRRYRGLTVVPGASTSSPGLAFMLTTRAAFGDEWTDYWADLMANDLKVVDGWSDAYYADFTGGSEKGKRPVVLSYDSSPAFTVTDDGEATRTAALLGTCFRQVEYAGVLEGADNPEGARELVEFLLGDDVQAALPTAMYVRPVSSQVEVPEEWSRFAPEPEESWEVSPEDISEQREAWLTEWTEVVTR